jgi:hypothetical protein
MEASPVANACRFLFCTAAFWNRSLRQRDTISDKVARYLGYHVASVRVFFAYGIVASGTPQI